MKVGDLYRQQLRVHAWRFVNRRLPENQAAMLQRVGEVHGYGTRSARGRLFLSTRDHRSIGYRVPKEWDSLTEGQRGSGSLGSLKRGSRGSWRAMGRLCAVCGDVMCVLRDRSQRGGLVGDFGYI